MRRQIRVGNEAEVRVAHAQLVIQAIAHEREGALLRHQRPQLLQAGRGKRDDDDLRAQRDNERLGDLVRRTAGGRGLVDDSANPLPVPEGEPQVQKLAQDLQQRFGR